MQQGIGRAGYLLLSFVFFAIGVFGLGLAWVAFQEATKPFFGLGLGVTALAMIGLWLFASFAPRVEPVMKPKVAKTQPTIVETAPEPVAPDVPVENFEFSDYEPAAQAAPEEVVLPPAFAAEAPPMPNAAPDVQAPVQFQVATPAAPARDPAAWPQRPGKSTWTKQQEHKAGIDAQVAESSRRHELTQRYTQTTPTLRHIMDDVPQTNPPQRVADRAPAGMNTDFVAPGMSVGRCGQCKTTLLAPEERPIRLKCPECAKVTNLD